MDVAIVEYLFGLVLWYSSKNKAWSTALVCAQLGLLLVFCIWMSVWMWFTMSTKGGLGEEETLATVKAKRTADD
jgi:hypothetical protein